MKLTSLLKHKDINMLACFDETMDSQGSPIIRVDKTSLNIHSLQGGIMFSTFLTFGTYTWIIWNYWESLGLFLFIKNVNVYASCVLVQF